MNDNFLGFIVLISMFLGLAIHWVLLLNILVAIIGDYEIWKSNKKSSGNEPKPKGEGGRKNANKR